MQESEREEDRRVFQMYGMISIRVFDKFGFATTFLDCWRATDPFLRAKELITYRLSGFVLLCFQRFEKTFRAEVK